MDSFAGYIPASIKMWLTIRTFAGANIAGLERLPILAANLKFPLGGLPVATFQVATGRRLPDQVDSPVHLQLSGLSDQFRVSAYIQCTGDEKPGLAWPPGVFRIWDGLSISAGASRDRDQLNFVIQSSHWLHELESGTMASADLAPNQMDALLSPFWAATSPSGVATSLQGLAYGADGREIWTGALLPMFEKCMTPNGGLAVQSHWGSILIGFASCKPPGGVDMTLPEQGNIRAWNILNTRFSGVTVNNQRYPDIASSLLPGDLRFYLEPFGHTFLRQIAQTVGYRMSSVGCLGKLASLSQLLMTQLVCNVENASIVPHMGAIHSSQIWRTIYPAEYTNLQSQAFTPRRLAGVGLFGSSFNSATTPSAGVATNAPKGGVMVGMFHRDAVGQVLLLPAPGWLTYVQPPERTTSILARAGTLRGAGIDPVTSGQVELSQKQTVGCALANFAWHDAVYKQRRAVLTGRFRLDISPGSQVRVKVNGPPVLEGGGSNADIYASVACVNLHLDANDPQIYTSFELDHIRVGSEASLAADRHPLFPRTPWYGSPLVKLRESDMMPESSSGIVFDESGAL